MTKSIDPSAQVITARIGSTREWAANAPNNEPIVVRDTDSAMGRYNLQTKEIGLKDIARIHGHMCDGLVIAFGGIRSCVEQSVFSRWCG